MDDTAAYPLAGLQAVIPLVYGLRRDIRSTFGVGMISEEVEKLMKPLFNWCEEAVATQSGIALVELAQEMRLPAPPAIPPVSAPKAHGLPRIRRKTPATDLCGGYDPLGRKKTTRDEADHDGG